MTYSSPSLRIGSIEKERPLQVSKWLEHPFLLDFEEMQELVSIMGEVFFCPAGVPVGHKEFLVLKETFLARYRDYIECLKKKRPLKDKELRRYFCQYVTSSLEMMYALKIGEDRFLIKPQKPIIQMQYHQFFVSKLDGKFHSMVLSEDSISWGIQLSYPQIYQDPNLASYSKVIESEEFPNTSLFKKIIQWLRYNTIPTPFELEGKRTNATFRIGKKCLPWIHQHSGLQAKGLLVVPPQ